MRSRPALRPHLAAALLALLAPARVDAQLVNFRHYTGAEGLPQAQVIGIAQDHDGFMWFATYGGVTRFNGHEFRTWTKHEGLASNSVFDIAQDSKGRLYLATSRGLCVMELGRFSCRGEKQGLVYEDARSVTVDGSDVVWVATSRGISRVRGDSISNFTTQQGLPSDRVQRIAVDAKQRVWAATSKGLARFNGSRFTQVGRDIIGDSAVQLVIPMGDALLVGSQGRLLIVNNDLVSSYASVKLPDSTMFVDGAVDNKGTIWIGTRTGALRIRGNEVHRITSANGLLSSLVLRVFIDREDNVWFGTETGASKHVPGPFRTYTMNEGLPSAFVRALEVDTRGVLWTGGRNGLARRDGERFTPVPVPGAPDMRVYALAAEPSGGLLIGTRLGLVWFRDGKATTYREADGLPGDVVFSVVKDGHGGAWLGTDRGLAHWSNGRVRTISVPDLPKASLIAIELDRRGRLWMGLTAGGVAIRDGERLTVINADSGATDQTIWSMREDTHGNMWVGTNGDGVLRVTDREGGGFTVTSFTTRDGLASDFIWQVLGDSNGDVWLFGNLGINRLRNDRWTHYGRGAGLVELEGAANASLEDADGNRWFGTGAGLVRYTRLHDVAPTAAPTVFIEKALIDDVPFASTGGERPRVSRGELRFDFASPVYRDEISTRYSYRLVGYNANWSKPTAEHGITYAGLSGGEYTLEVRAHNGDQVSEPASMSFTVMPPFWQTWWFVTLVILGLGAAGGALPFFRARALERERRRLEALVEQHTHELAEKNARLQQSNRDLEHFAYVASHDLQEPLRKIQAFSDRVTKLYSPKLDDQGRDYLSRMSGAASRMQRLIDDLLSLSRVTTKRNPVERINLSVLAQDVLGDLEFRLQSTNGRVIIGELPEIVGDPVQIRQVFQNLIGNALKFHKPGVHPVVTVEAAARDARTVELRFSDNGIGFQSADAERVFLPFQRLHGRSQYEGTGIGLTIVQKIADRHGGNVRAESTPGVGSTFIVTLPFNGPNGDREDVRHAA